MYKRQALGVFLPLITTNCAVLGVALTNVQKDYGILTGVVNGFGTALGFTIAIVIMAGIRERLEDNDISPSWKGSPIVLEMCIRDSCGDARAASQGWKRCGNLEIQKIEAAIEAILFTMGQSVEVKTCLLYTSWDQ